MINQNKNNDVNQIRLQIAELRRLLSNRNVNEMNKKAGSIQSQQNVGVDSRQSGKEIILDANSVKSETVKMDGVNQAPAQSLKDKIISNVKTTNSASQVASKSKAEQVLDNLENELNLLMLENVRLREDKLKALADLENGRKLLVTELNDYKKYSNLSFARELLPAVDNFDRALQFNVNNASNEVKNFLLGFKMIQKSLADALVKADVLEIPTKIGDQFNSHIHECLEAVESNGQPSGTIVKINQKGYKLHDRIIRPVSVNVVK